MTIKTHCTETLFRPRCHLRRIRYARVWIYLLAVENLLNQRYDVGSYPGCLPSGPPILPGLVCGCNRSKIESVSPWRKTQSLYSGQFWAPMPRWRSRIDTS